MRNKALSPGYARATARRGRQLARRAVSRPSPVSFAAISSGEFLIRELEPGDATAWTRARRANELRMRPWWPDVQDWQLATDEVAFWGHYLEFRAMQRRGSALPLAITSTDGLIGELLLWRLDPSRLSAEVGIWVSADARPGRALMGALRGFLDRFLLEMDYTRLEAPVAVGNSNPVRMVETLGFVMEGTLRKWRRDPAGNPHDYDMWALTQDDWRTARDRLGRFTPVGDAPPQAGQSRAGEAPVSGDA